MKKLLLVSTMLFAGSLFAAEYPNVENRIVELHIFHKEKEPEPITNSKRIRSSGVINLPKGSVCSGSFIDSMGDIITAGHCAQNVDTIEVITFDKQEYEATIVAVSATHDLALLHIDKLNTPHFSPAQVIERGERIFILGSPLAITDTLSTGIIAKLAGDTTLVDCGALPGNSGSAVFDNNGDLVGVLTAGHVVMFGVTHLNIIQSLDAVYFFVQEALKGRE